MMFYKVNKSARTALFAALLGLCAWMAIPGTAQAERFIIGYKHAPARNVAADQINQAAPDAQVKRGLANSKNLVVVVPHSQAAELKNELEDQSNVRFVEPDRPLKTFSNPNDPYWGQLWGMSKIGLPFAWASGLGSPVTVAVVDTGVSLAHPDLANQLWNNPAETAGNGIDDDHNGLVDDVHGADYSSKDANPEDGNGHGTHVSGTIAGQKDNGLGVAGAAPSARIMALRFMDNNGSGYTSDAISAIDYAVTHGAKVINNSWGGAGYSQSLADSISRARTAGVLFVAAAGNSSQNIDQNPSYPAAYTQDNVLTVAATDDSDSMASFSNYGSSGVDMGAPGVRIISSWLNSGYANLSGTSMATPHVVGVAAWLWGLRPTATYSQIRLALINGGTTVSSLASRTASGKRLDAVGALAYLDGLLGSNPPTPPLPAPDPSGPTNTVAPSIKLTGHVAACLAGRWTPAPARLAYNWIRGGVLSKITTASVVIADNDYSKSLVCRVTATGSNGKSTQASSQPLLVPKPAPTKLPRITGSTRIGQPLNCDSGSWMYGPVSLTYSWYRDSVLLPSATSSSRYLVSSQDSGHWISCSVTARNQTGSTTTTSPIVLVPYSLYGKRLLPAQHARHS